MSSARRYTASYWLSMALLALAAALVVAFFWLGGFFSNNPPDDANKPAEALNKQQVIARTLLLKGQDEQGRRYEIHAVSSLRDENRKGIIFLEKVSGRIDASDGVPMIFSARRAEVDEKTREVTLIEQVRIAKPGKWRLRGERVIFDTRSNDLRSDEPVVVRMNKTIIEAPGMRTRKGGAVILFNGKVRTRFEDTTAPRDDALPDATNDSQP